MRPMDDARQRMQRLVGRAWDEARSPLYRNAFFIMLASLIGSLLGFVFLYVVYQTYDLTDAGYAATMVNTVTFLVGIGSLGMPIALVRFLPESDDPTALVNTSLSISGVLSASLALAFVVSLGFWSPNLLVVFGHPVYLLIIPLTAMAYAFGPVLDQAAIALRRADLFAIRVVLLSVIKVPLPILFVTAFATVLGGTLGVYMSWSLSFAVSVIVVGLVLLPRVIPGYRPRPRLSRRRLRPMFRFSVGNWLAGLIGSAGSLLLTLLIINTLPKATASTATAVYYAVTVMAGILLVIPQATMTSLYAEASQRNANRRRDERRAIALSIALLIPAIVGMWVFADVLLRLFEKPTLADLGAQPLRILSLSSIPVFLNSVFGTRLRVRKEIIPLIVSAAIGSAVTLGLGYVLLQSSGLVGLAIAVVIGQAASTPYLLVVAGRPMEEEPMLAPTPRP
ncbi:MAG TPA: lipopolysaccharide biosynthesis protein [Thermoplasmata archaeon]|nr:lipopolysaccharide biosynthesis protein [Thermoplasmata archaeon]